MLLTPQSVRVLYVHDVWCRWWDIWQVRNLQQCGTWKLHKFLCGFLTGVAAIGH